MGGTKGGRKFSDIPGRPGCAKCAGPVPVVNTDKLTGNRRFRKYCFKCAPIQKANRRKLCLPKPKIIEKKNESHHYKHITVWPKSIPIGNGLMSAERFDYAKEFTRLYGVEIMSPEYDRFTGDEMHKLLRSGIKDFVLNSRKPCTSFSACLLSHEGPIFKLCFSGLSQQRIKDLYNLNILNREACREYVAECYLLREAMKKPKIVTLGLGEELRKPLLVGDC